MKQTFAICLLTFMIPLTAVATDQLPQIKTKQDNKPEGQSKPKKFQKLWKQANSSVLEIFSK